MEHQIMTPPTTTIIDFDDLEEDEGEKFSEALIDLLRKQLEIDERLKALIKFVK